MVDKAMLEVSVERLFSVDQAPFIAEARSVGG